MPCLVIARDWHLHTTLQRFSQHGRALRYTSWFINLERTLVTFALPRHLVSSHTIAVMVYGLDLKSFIFSQPTSPLQLPTLPRISSSTRSASSKNWRYINHVLSYLLTFMQFYSHLSSPAAWARHSPLS